MAGKGGEIGYVLVRNCESSCKMNAITPVGADRLEKIARMVLYDVPHTQIALAVGVSESRVTQIIETDDFKNTMQSIASERFEQDSSINTGWDHLEAVALKNVLEKMQWNADPEFALKAAMMANKAQRRGQFNNRPLDGRDGVRAVINLTAAFIDQLNQSTVNVGKNGNSAPVLEMSRENGPDSPEQKKQDFLPPERLDDLFRPDDMKISDDLADFMPDQVLMPAE